MRTACFVVLAAVVFGLLKSPAFASTSYTVNPGDSLWAIAQREHVSVAALEAANHLSDSSVLQLGQQLIIPGAASSASKIGVLRTPATSVPANIRATKHFAKRPLSTRHHRVAAAHVESASLGSGDFAVANALWTATHGGVAPPAIAGITPYSVAVRALAFETRITSTAMRYLGVPYMWGGTSLYGVDCSGFVWSVFHHNGIDLPRMADEQYAASHRVAWRAMRPGDLVFFETYTSGVSHVGIYLGRGRFIHASASDGVRVDSLGADYYSSRFVGAGRLSR